MKIKTFETGKSLIETEIKQFKVPKPRPRNSGIDRIDKNRPMHARYMHEILETNEYLAYEGLAKTNEVIQREFLLKHKRNSSLRYQFKTYRATIGMFRNKYNKGILYSAQPAPYFMSFAYDENGYILVGGNRSTQYMMFYDCYARCINYRIADPRFVEYDLIVEIRNRQNEGIAEWMDWIVPTDDIIKRLCTKVGVDDLYNSVTFPMGWTREETPKDYESPFID